MHGLKSGGGKGRFVKNARTCGMRPWRFGTERNGSSGTRGRAENGEKEAISIAEQFSEESPHPHH